MSTKRNFLIAVVVISAIAAAAAIAISIMRKSRSH